MVQETAIRPISDELPNVPHPFGFIRPSKSAEAGSHAGVHTETMRAEYRAGGEGMPFAFYDKDGRYHFIRFPFSVDPLEAVLSARQWANDFGYTYDGELTEAGLVAAMRAV